MRKKTQQKLKAVESAPVTAIAGDCELYCDRSLNWIHQKKTPLSTLRYRQLQRTWLARYLALEDPITAYCEVVATYLKVDVSQVDPDEARRNVMSFIHDEWVQKQLEQFNKEMFVGALVSREQLLCRLEKLSRTAKFDGDKIKAIRALGEEAFGMWKEKQVQQGFSLVEILRELNGETSVKIATTEPVGGEIQ